MNEIRRIDGDVRQLETARAVVERHGWPEYISGYDAHSKEILGDPAIEIFYRLKNVVLPPDENWRDRGRELARLTLSVDRLLLEADPTIIAYFRMLDPEAS